MKFTKRAFTLIELPVVRKRAFTLIELLIVIAIIGILASVILISLNSARKKAQDSQIKSDVTSLSNALEIVKIDRNLTITNWAVLTTAAIANDSNITRWTDSGDPATGNQLVSKLPVSPVLEGNNSAPYWIKIINGASYSIVTRLNATGSYYCMENGSASVLTGQALLSNAESACEPN